MLVCKDRGYEKDILLIPGWAADHKVFDLMDISFNYIIISNPDPYKLESELESFLSGGLKKKIAVMGWSMGAYLACKIVVKYPNIVDSTALISVRPSYPKDEIEALKENINKNKRAALYKFYTEFFSRSERDSLSYFKKNLMKYYLDEFSEDILIKGLDYILAHKIDPRAVKDFNINIIHGEEDKIAPLSDVIKLKKVLTKANFIIIPGAGHVPFLRREFKALY